MDIPAHTELAVSLVERAASLSSDELFYLRAYTRAKLKSERTPMLLRALFVTAIGTVEPLVTRMVLLLLYYANPGQYGSLSAAELEDDARSLCYGPAREVAQVAGYQARRHHPCRGHRLGAADASVGRPERHRPPRQHH